MKVRFRLYRVSTYVDDAPVESDAEQEHWTTSLANARSRAHGFRKGDASEYRSVEIHRVIVGGGSPLKLVLACLNRRGFIVQTEDLERWETTTERKYSGYGDEVDFDVVFKWRRE